MSKLDSEMSKLDSEIEGSGDMAAVTINSEAELDVGEQGDTEIDLKKEEHMIHNVDQKDSTAESSYSLCGLTQGSTISSETLLSELSVHKDLRINRYAYEAGDDRYKSKSKSKSKSKETDAVDSKNKKEADATTLREEAISETLLTIKKALQVDLCFVLDCTGSMMSYIDAAKNCIQQVVEHMEQTNPNIKLWIGFCGYRDHCDDSDRIQILDFTDSYENFKSYLSDEVKATGGGDAPEDVLGGLDAATNKMKWSHRTRVLLHLGDAPPHGRRFTSSYDTYPDGDPNGLTAESVLENIKSEEILYYFGKITSQTDKMINVFREIIGEFLIFDLNMDGRDPKALTTKLFEAVCSSITSSVILTSSETGNVYRHRRKNLEKNLEKPEWDALPIETGKLLHYRYPKTLADIKNSYYFDKSNLVLKKFTYKRAPKPFSSGSERYAYYALDLTREPAEEIIMKESVELGKKANSLERYLEMIETSTIAYFLSKEFNAAAKQAKIKKKVNFLKPQALRHKDSEGDNDGSHIKCYTIEPKFHDEFKRFNINNGVIKEYHSTLEAFAHYTYEYTKGYLVVYDLQGIETGGDQFLLTDPAIHCEDKLRFGKTNLGERGIKECFLANHKCSNVCEKLALAKITNES
ncbi:hypothetical protein RclHR1_00200039 [Rhizophagus clarus]|nr:hypothetical protein RclHR1_00200039 [Rhizophagus clarus]